MSVAVGLYGELRSLIRENNAMLVRAAKRLGYKDIVVHTLWHSCLSRYGRLGLSVFQLRAISGHRSARMLERYVKVDSLSVLGAMDNN